MPRCRTCKDKFEARYFNQKFCMDKDECIKAFAQYAGGIQRKIVARERIEKKKSLLTHSDWLNILQKVFNTFIRIRDKDKPCISSGKPLKGKFDAGHFYSVGGNPSLRFNEFNVHGQSVHDNRDKHGNLLEYAERLPERIGIENFNALKADRHKTLKLSIPEIQEKIKEYKNKIRLLK